VDVTFHAITPEAAHALITWRYPAPYDVYNIKDEQAALAEMLDARSPWFVAFDENGRPMGYCCFGTAAEINWEGEPRLWTTDDKALSVGLGLRPNLTGLGIGPLFFNAVLTFATIQFGRDSFRLFVLPFNQRAIRVYERAGFRQVDEHIVNVGGQRELIFLEMRREEERTLGVVIKPKPVLSNHEAKQPGNSDDHPIQ
jgi:[ribosomal protein S18]-alanine N-acetyltransferase